MSAPVRMQLSRAKGFDLQAASRAINGREAVHVARPGVWGNPYRLDDSYAAWARLPWQSREQRQACVDHYRRSAEQGFVTVPNTYLTPEERGDKHYSSGAHRVHEVAPKYLRGKNLACWCKPGDPCHADVLLEIANA